MADTSSLLAKQPLSPQEVAARQSVQMLFESKQKRLDADEINLSGLLIEDGLRFLAQRLKRDIHSSRRRLVVHFAPGITRGNTQRQSPAALPCSDASSPIQCCACLCSLESPTLSLATGALPTLSPLLMISAMKSSIMELLSKRGLEAREEFNVLTK